MRELAAGRDCAPTEARICASFDHWLREPLKACMEIGLQHVGAGTGLQLPAVQDTWKRFLLSPVGTDWIRPWSLFVLIQYLEANDLKLST